MFLYLIFLEKFSRKIFSFQKILVVRRESITAKIKKPKPTGRTSINQLECSLKLYHQHQQSLKFGSNTVKFPLTTQQQQQQHDSMKNPGQGDTEIMNHLFCPILLNNKYLTGKQLLPPSSLNDAECL